MSRFAITAPRRATGIPTLPVLPRLPVLALALAAVVMAFTARPAAADGDKAAESYISDLAVETLEVLSDPQRSHADKTGAFRRLLVTNTAIERFGRSALGQYSRLPTDSEFDEYVDALEDYAVMLLYSRFSLFADHSIEVTGSEVVERRTTTYVVVPTEVRDPAHSLVATVQWILLKEDSGYRIFDIRVQTPSESATFSLLSTQRDEFTQILRTNGRDMAALINFLRENSSIPAPQDRDAALTELTQ